MLPACLRVRPNTQQTNSISPLESPLPPPPRRLASSACIATTKHQKVARRTGWKSGSTAAGSRGGREGGKRGSQEAAHPRPWRSGRRSWERRPEKYAGSGSGGGGDDTRRCYRRKRKGHVKPDRIAEGVGFIQRRGNCSRSGHARGAIHGVRDEMLSLGVEQLPE